MGAPNSFSSPHDNTIPQASVEAMISNQIASQISSQLSQSLTQDGKSQDCSALPHGSAMHRTPSSSPSKGRSFSESVPTLSPSPKFREPRRESKDDSVTPSLPHTPRRPDFLSRGLSLQMPPNEGGMPSPGHLTSKAPLSPQLDRTNSYGSPIHLLPRRSRGAEFSRACTNLHHSTLAEQSSPDSSPTITQKAMLIPQRNHHRTNSMISDSPGGSMWITGGHGDKFAPSSSVGSINMLGSDDSSSSSDEIDSMDPDDNDDPMLMTPQAMKSISNPISMPFGGPMVPSPGGGGGWPNAFSPAGPSFLSIQRARLRKGRSRKSSSSASGHSSMASPGPGSPPQNKGLEGGGGYFAREAVMRKARSRRESLSVHTNDLHISSGNDSGDEAGLTGPTTPGVVRRPVTRRGNLLPKSRQFGRIKAELIEESTPLDSELRREAEIIRQVRESDGSYDILQPGTAHSSPTLVPKTEPDSLEDIPEDNSMSVDGTSGTTMRGLFGGYNSQALGLAFGSGRGSWSHETAQTPPPSLFPRGSSSALSEDLSMDSPLTSTPSVSKDLNTNGSGASRSGTPQASVPPPTAADGIKKSNKRRRDDDLDVHSIKRRAVSPGMSVQNSPILSQSPSQRDGGLWGTRGPSREGSVVSGHAAGERSNSGGSLANVQMTPGLGPKRIGLQGMTDTNDGLMKMTIE